MRKLFIILLSAVMLSGCKRGQEIEIQPSEHLLFINRGTLFAGAFRDSDTGVWYILSSKGVTPRLNTDGSLYVTE